jgi:hypothetical protein
MLFYGTSAQPPLFSHLMNQIAPKQVVGALCLQV